jgi:hypothetical protein
MLPFAVLFTIFNLRDFFNMSDASFPFLGIIIILAEVLWIVTYRRRYNAEVYTYIQEKCKRKSYAAHDTMGVGVFGVTKNYFFFQPRKRNVKATIINKAYISAYSFEPVATGGYTSVSSNGITSTFQNKVMILTLKIVPPNEEEHYFSFELNEYKRFYKHLDLPQFAHQNAENSAKKFL